MRKTSLLVVLLLFVNCLLGQNNSKFISQVIPSEVGFNETFSVSIIFRNTGSTTWKNSGLYRLGSENPRDNNTWGLGRLELPHDVAPGEQVTFVTDLIAPESGDGYGYFMQWRMVQDGVEWFGEFSEKHHILVGKNVLSDRLLTNTTTPFSISSHIVGTSMFHWYGANTGQLSSPWIPLEGRKNWTGEVEFWKTMIKQSMAANIDVFYVLLIPTMEAERLNLFRALNELRREGWDVPKVCPFFDPIISYTIKGVRGNAGTEPGKDEIVGHYIRFYKQYFSMNTDQYADEFIYSQDNVPVLDTWHVHLHIDNYNQLTRQDIEHRLRAEFGEEHPIFNNGIKMITTAISPTFSFADEKVHQFEIHSYFELSNYNSIVSVQLKPGYWDQNVRNPGYFLPRNGGSKYTNAWAQVDSLVDRVYIESFNEYDEGSGIYATRTDTVYIKTNGDSNNTNTDTWSATDDPHEYIKTTARGAAEFNDNEQLGAKIIWNDIPDTMNPGDTINATVVVRNTGNEKWNDVNGFKFGQQDIDPMLFGSNHSLIDDTQNDIPDLGGIFRGRTITFNLEIIAPDTEGEFLTHWGMLQENVAWFGEVLEKNITVSLTTDIDQNNVQKEFKIYPNPVSTNSSIQLCGDFKRNDRVILVGINGNIVSEEKILSDNKSVSLNLQKNNIKAGIYIIKLVSNNSIQTKKVIIKNREI